MSTLDLNGMNITLPDGTVFMTTYLTGSNDVTNNGLLDATLTEGGGPAGDTYSGVISDGTHATTAITQTSGEVTFTAANTYSGGTSLEGGILGIANASALGTGALTMAADTTLRAAASLTLSNAIAFAGSATIDTNGYDLTLAGHVTGSGSLTIAGTGELTLEPGVISSTSSYSGNIFLDSGTLSLPGPEVFIGPPPPMTLGSGTLYMAAGTTLDLPGGAKFFIPPDVTNNIVLDGAATITSTYGYIGATPSLAGVISGSGSLTVDGPLILTGINTYTGGTIIDAVVIVTGSITGNVADYGTLIFDNPGPWTFGGQISGSGSLTAEGLLTLSGASSNTGGTLVTAGTTTASNNLAFGSGTVTVSGGVLQSGIAALTLANAIVINAGSTVQSATSGWTITLSSSASLANNGTLAASGGTLIVDGAVTGSGKAFITGGGTLQFAANFQQAVTFGGPGTLALSQLYNGTISNFGAGDAIDFTALAYKSSYQVIWLQNGSQGMVAIEDTAANDTVVDSVTLNGTYNADSFRVAQDSQGGTEIVGNPAPPYDFNRDGISDVLLQNSSSGQAYIWLMNGTTVTSSGFAGSNTDPTWQVVTGAGDYNGDGKSDILWQNIVNGQVYEYQMNGTSVLASSLIGNNTDPNWQAVASGDFNGDGYSDILFQNSGSGQVYEWEMNGFSIIGSGFVGNNTDPSWQVVGTGDFTGSGIDDVLFQNVTSGQVYEWQMNGTAVVASGFVGNNTDPAWHVVGIGDFTGNGIDDVLFQNVTSGQVYEWQMNGLSVVSGGLVGNNTDPTWHVIGTGDFTGNGIDDVLFQNVSSGQVYEWQMNGLSVVSSGFVGNNTDPNWHAIGKS